MGAIVVDSPGPFVSAYKPVQWTFVSDRSPNTIPGESGVQIWLIAVADQVTVITIAGPTVRFTMERMQALAPELLSVAQQLAAASGASPFFQLTAETAAPGDVKSRKPIYAV